MKPRRALITNFGNNLFTFTFPLCPLEILEHPGKARREANEASACSHAEDSSHQRRRLDIVSRPARFIPTPTTSLYAPIPDIVRTGNLKNYVFYCWEENTKHFHFQCYN